MNKKINIIFALLTLAVMSGIFILSCENADKSSETSGFFVNLVLKAFYPDFSSMSADEQQEILSGLSFAVRKTAHFTAYTALGFCASLSFRKKKLFSVKSAGTVAFCFLYACSDELHQYFVPGRACMFTDVLIDTSGSITGIIISAFILFAAAKLSHKKSRDIS